jgi:hypothetical protein
MAENIKDSFEIEPPLIPPKDIKETFITDVVVVGAGTSGKAAALSAAEAGAKVIQIDKHVTYRWSGGLIAAVDSRLQKKMGIKVDNGHHRHSEVPAPISISVIDVRPTTYCLWGIPSKSAAVSTLLMKSLRSLKTAGISLLD